MNIFFMPDSYTFERQPLLTAAAVDHAMVEKKTNCFQAFLYEISAR